MIGPAARDKFDEVVLFVLEDPLQPRPRSLALHRKVLFKIA